MDLLNISWSRAQRSTSHESDVSSFCFWSLVVLLCFFFFFFFFFFLALILGQLYLKKKKNHILTNVSPLLPPPPPPRLRNVQNHCLHSPPPPPPLSLSLSTHSVLMHTPTRLSSSPGEIAASTITKRTDNENKMKNLLRSLSSPRLQIAYLSRLSYATVKELERKKNPTMQQDFFVLFGLFCFYNAVVSF